MTDTKDLTALIARLLLGGFFVLAGLGKLGDVPGFAGYVASGGLPAALAWPVILFELAAGLALIAGLQTRLASLSLAAFCLLSGTLYHFVPANQMQMTMFMKNIALAGGYLALAGLGAGRYALDARMGRAAIA